MRADRLLHASEPLLGRVGRLWRLGTRGPLVVLWSGSVRDQSADQCDVHSSGVGLSAHRRHARRMSVTHMWRRSKGVVSPPCTHACSSTNLLQM